MHWLIERLSLLNLFQQPRWYSRRQALCYMRTKESDEEKKCAERQARGERLQTTTRLCNSR